MVAPLANEVRRILTSSNSHRTSTISSRCAIPKNISAKLDSSKRERRAIIMQAFPPGRKAETANPATPLAVCWGSCSPVRQWNVPNFGLPREPFGPLVLGSKFMMPFKQTRLAGLQWGIMAVAALVLSLGTIGCGGGSGSGAHLQGTVTIGGKPLPADATGNVFFAPATPGKEKAVSADIVNGKYDCPHAPVGAVKVTFNIVQPTGPEYTTDRGVKTRDMKNLLPPSASAGVDLQVSGDNAEQNFDL
jgi:hypothetical protein